MNADTKGAAPAGPSPSDVRVLAHITPTVERDYKQRGVFPELRFDSAERTYNGRGVHRLTGDRAREVLADAKARAAIAGLPRGLPWAFKSLAGSIESELAWHERHADDDPGPEAAQQRLSTGIACFGVGDEALYWCPGSPYPTRVCIRTPYQLLAVASANGTYRRIDGQRIDYRCGYTYEAGGFDYFAPAHLLTDLESKRMHLRLATADGIPTMAWLAATKASELQSMSTTATTRG